MHRLARRAWYSSDRFTQAGRRCIRLGPSRTRPAGGGPLLYDRVADQLRHLRHRSRPQCGRAVPPAAHHPSAGSGRDPPPPPLAAAAPGPGGDAPPSPLPAAVAVRARRPARDYSSASSLGWGTCLRHCPRPPQRAGAGATRAAARVGPRGSTDCGRTLRSIGAVARAVRGAASRTASPSWGRARGPDIGGGGSAGAVAPWWDRRGRRALREPTAVSSPRLGPPPGPAVGSLSDEPRPPRRACATSARQDGSRVATGKACTDRRGCHHGHAS
jgi:hypothetical protein